MKTTPQEIIAGLDIGTTKICVVIGKRRTDGIEIIGVGQSPSCGVKRGIVVNLESTATAIHTAGVTGSIPVTPTNKNKELRQKL